MSLDPKKVEEYRKNMEAAKSSTEENVKKLLDLADAQRDVLFFSRDYASEVKSASKELGVNSIQASETAKAFEKVASAAKGITDNYSDILAGEKKLESIQQSRIKLIDATNSLQTEYEQFLQTTLGNEEAINDVLAGRINLEDAIADSAERGYISYDQIDAALELKGIFEGINAELEAEADNMAEIERRAENIEGAMNFGGSSIGLEDVADNLGSVLDKLGMGDLSKKLGIEDAIGETRSFAANLTEGGNKVAGMGDKMKIAKNLAGGLGKNLMKALGPAGLLASAVQMLVEAFSFVDKASGEVAKEFGVSAEEGMKIVEAANDAAGASGDLLVSTKDVLSAQKALNKEFGTAVQFSGEMAAEYASIAERTGLSTEAMGTFASNAMITGTTIKDQLADVTAVTMELNNQNGIALSVKDIQEGIGKASKAALLTAGRNTKELANQVYQAKLLGVEQSKVEGISDSLLDFEGSIAKELEAELLLGRDINLEKARAAALEGDLATVASEVNKQLEDGKDFSELNVIQQKALAESVGMTRDELAAALVEQEKLAAIQGAFGDDIQSMSDAQAEYNRLKAEGLLTEEKMAELAEAGLLNQLESASQAEKFAAFQEKIQDLFVQIASGLMPIVSMLTEVLEQLLTPIFEILNPILDVLTQVVKMALMPLVAQLKFAANLLMAIIEPIFNALLPPIQKLMGFFDEISAKLGEIFGSASDGAGIFEYIGEVINMLIMPAMVAFEAAIDAIISILDGLMDAFEGIAMILSGDIVEGFKTLGKGLAKILLSPFQMAVDLVIGVINGIIRGVNKIPGVNFSTLDGVDLAEAIGIADDVKEEKEKESGASKEADSSGRPTVGLAEGGIVTKPTTALIGEGGEPEAVTPLSKIGSFLGDALSYTPMGMAAKGIGSLMDSDKGSSVNDERVVVLLERLVTAVEKGGIVELDGNKVGTALGLSSYKTQ